MVDTANARTEDAPSAAIADALGRRLRDLRISVTDRCNFRCPYCMPAEIYGENYKFLPRPALLSFEELVRLARIFAELGTKKIRITGGEPLIRHGVQELIGKLKRIPGIEDLSLTTNGFLLAKYAQELADAGLDRVTVSLDSLDPEIFRQMSGRTFGPEKTLEGIEAAAAAGLAPVKINTVVRRGVNEHGIPALVERFRGTGHVLRFIEYMDVGTLNGWERGEVVPAEEIVKAVETVAPLERIPPNYAGEVAQRWAFRDGSGEVGVIASVTAPFCGGCTRARLTIEGRLVTCLFAAGGIDLKGPLRAGASDEVLRERIAGTWHARRDRYSEERAEAGGAPRPKIEMYQLGG